LSLGSALICGPTKMPSLTFACESAGNLLLRKLKQFPFQSRALTSWFIIPNYMCKSGKIIFPWSIKLFLSMFLQPCISLVLWVHCLCVQCLSWAPLSHSQM
jgi:hypothetical protein